MPTPDSVVTTRGEAVTLSRVTAPIYGAHGSFDEAASTKESVATTAIVSRPRQRNLPPRMQDQEGLQLTVLSSLDVRSDRPGRADRFTVRGLVYQVMEVRDDRHPFHSNVKKKTVLLAQLAIPQGSP